MKEKLIKIFPFLLILCLLFGMVACKENDSSGPSDSTEPAEQDPYELNLADDDFTYFESFKMNENRHLKVFGYNVERGLSGSDILAGAAIQGLFAQTAAEYYCSGSYHHSMWLNEICKEYGLTTENVTIAQMVEDYKTRFGENAGYILYNRSQNGESKNVAVTICGVEGWIPVDASVEQKYIDLGLTKKLDVTDKNDRWCFENYKDKLNNSGLCQLAGGVEMMCDYAISCKYYSFYQSKETLEALQLRGEVHEWTKTDSPVFGWGPIDETSHVNVSSMNGNFTIASDWSANLSVFSCTEFFGVKQLKQMVQYERKEVENKHYVCIVCSDGDNIQALSNTLSPDASKKYFAAERADFPMGWNISPSAIDIQPALQRYIYNQIGSAGDYLVAAVSGQGYINPSVYPDLSDFCGRLATYLKRGDLTTLQILDTCVTEDVVEYYSRVPGLLGVQCMIGDYYAAEKGSVYWSENGMPFVTCRLSLWEPETGASIAEKINNFPVNPRSIEGYTLVNLHPWSRDYSDAVEMYQNLDDDVEIVTAEQFFQLIRENVPHVNVSLKG